MEKEKKVEYSTVVYKINKIKEKSHYYLTYYYIITQLKNGNILDILY